ncbi:MAG: GNAT family N-acetyltransferase [Chitinophagaceae bacterium]
MIRADRKDKERIIDILTSSFEENKSVNYIIQQDGKRMERIRNLMDYSFELCHMFGHVFLSDDKKACALILLPDKKKTSIKSILLDMKLITSSMGISNIKKAMEREAKVKRLHPKGLIYYLWYIGVDAEEQNMGIGSSLLKEVLKESYTKQRPVYLETSELKNIPWYEKFGFKIYNELDLGYKLIFMKRD